MLHHRIHRQNRNIIRKRHSFRFQTAAVDFQRRVLLPKKRNVLIHDPAGHAHEIALGTLAKSGHFQPIEFPALKQRQS